MDEHKEYSQIAEELNQAGYRTHEGNNFDADVIYAFIKMRDDIMSFYDRLNQGHQEIQTLLNAIPANTFDKTQQIVNRLKELKAQTTTKTFNKYFAGHPNFTYSYDKIEWTQAPLPPLRLADGTVRENTTLWDLALEIAEDVTNGNLAEAKNQVDAIHERLRDILLTIHHPYAEMMTKKLLLDNLKYRIAEDGTVYDPEQELSEQQIAEINQILRNPVEKGKKSLPTIVQAVEIYNNQAGDTTITKQDVMRAYARGQIEVSDPFAHSENLKRLYRYVLLLLEQYRASLVDDLHSQQNDEEAQRSYQQDYEEYFEKLTKVLAIGSDPDATDTQNTIAKLLNHQLQPLQKSFETAVEQGRLDEAEVVWSYPNRMNHDSYIHLSLHTETTLRQLFAGDATNVHLIPVFEGKEPRREIYLVKRSDLIMATVRFLDTQAQAQQEKYPSKNAFYREVAAELNELFTTELHPLGNHFTWNMIRDNIDRAEYTVVSV